MRMTNSLCQAVRCDRLADQASSADAREAFRILAQNWRMLADRDSHYWETREHAKTIPANPRYPL
jgi:hypothetical protein